MKRIVHVCGVVLMAHVFLVGCATIPRPARNKDGTFESGPDYCDRIAATTDSASQSSLGWGIGLAIPAVAAAVVGLAMGPDTSSSAGWVGANRNALTVSAGALLALPAGLLLARSVSLSGISSQAGEATQLPDKEGREACLKLRSAILTARSQLAKGFQDRLSEDLQAAKLVLEESQSRIAALQGERDALESRLQESQAALAQKKNDFRVAEAAVLIRPNDTNAKADFAAASKKVVDAQVEVANTEKSIESTKAMILEAQKNSTQAAGVVVEILKKAGEEAKSPQPQETPTPPQP